MSLIEGEQYVRQAAIRFAGTDEPVNQNDCVDVYTQSMIDGIMVTWGEALRLIPMVESYRDADLFFGQAAIRRVHRPSFVFAAVSAITQEIDQYYWSER